MAYISKKDSNGVKGPLAEGELGLDITGSDDGRIGVGTATGNVLLAKKSEVDALDTRLDDIEGKSTVADYGITDAYTKTEVDTLLDGQNDAAEIAYDNAASGLTATTLQEGVDEIDTALDTLNADVSTEGSVLKSIKDTAENATYTNTTSGLTATTVAGAIDEVESRVDASEVAKDELKAVTGTTVDTRYDKLLAVRDVIDMEYVDGDLSTVRYEGDDDAAVYYRDVMTYDVDGNLAEVKHYYNTADLVTASGQTVLAYVAGNLATATYSE
jgi:hypothetical protein